MLQKVKYTKAFQEQFARGAKAFKKVQEAKEAQIPQPPQEINPDLPYIVISDIDSTIAEKGNRGIYEFEKAGCDKPIKATCEILRGMHLLGYLVALITGRPETSREVTEKWLKDNGIHYNYLFMRNPVDMRRNVIYKEDSYVSNIRGKFNTLFVMEDGKEACEMFKGKQGLRVFEI